jgi:Membrane transport protein MerF
MAMKDRALIAAGLGGAIAAVTCCASQLLAITLGTAGLTAWLANSAYVLVPVLLISAALIGVRVFRRRPTPCSNAAAREQMRKS